MTSLAGDTAAPSSTSAAALSSATDGIDVASGTTVSVAMSGSGDAARADSDHGVVLFRKGEEGVQVHVPAPGLQKASLDITEQAAGAV